MPEDIEHRLRPDELTLFKGKVWRGAGCPACNGSGQRGRIGYFELLLITGSLRKAISDNVPASELPRFAPESFRTMRQDGLEKASGGMTTIEEVLRATQDAEDTVV
jgi:type II secretory ATPase GspE/PulE/Tfp pilus assembly ATPase PilB-like protein